MPIYEYECQACGYTFENIQKFSDPLLTTCPNCSKEKLSKLISNSSFFLKGSGWHLTDYKNNSCQANCSNTKKTLNSEVPPCSQKNKPCCQATETST